MSHDTRVPKTKKPQSQFFAKLGIFYDPFFIHKLTFSLLFQLVDLKFKYKYEPTKLVKEDLLKSNSFSRVSSQTKQLSDK